MKMSDILHSIADMLDQKDGGLEAPENTEKSADDFQHDVDDGAESGDKDANIGNFIPPLQTKLEILKKSAGMDNAFNQDDELNDIKKLSGVKPIAIQFASEDNDIVG